MATTTTNYGFDIPQSTDLVKDGATAIATLGQDIDTAMNTALGTKKAGMVLLNTTSFSAVSSVSLAASTFTSTYDNYVVIYKFTATASAALRARLRVSGTDASGANYNEMDVTTGTASGPSRQGTSNGTEWNMVNLAISSINSLNLTFLDPAKALPTTMTGFGNRNAAEGFTYTKDHTLSTAYDSFTIYATGGTITGAYSVYGYNK
jgi:hypothetical protein